jgi:excisionase family DNA binding protein
MSEWLTTNEAARYCKVGRRTFTRWVRESGIRPDGRVGLGQRARYSTHSLDGLMRMMADRPKTKARAASSGARAAQVTA